MSESDHATRLPPDHAARLERARLSLDGLSVGDDGMMQVTTSTIAFNEPVIIRCVHNTDARKRAPVLPRAVVGPQQSVALIIDPLGGVQGILKKPDLLPHTLSNGGNLQTIAFILAVA